MVAVTPSRRRGRLPAVVAAVAVGLAGCSGTDDGGTSEALPPSSSPSATPTTATPSPSAGSPTTSGTPSSTPTRTGLPDAALGAALARDLEAPWGVAVAPDGTAYLAERDSGRVLRRAPDGTTTTLGTVPGVEAGGEGGLLGLAVAPAEPQVLLAYFTASGDNRVVRVPLTGDGLGRPEPILTGIPSGRVHNGGRLLVAADGTLFVGTGDAGERSESQDRDSLGGKILRITTTGDVPADNPVAGSPVWSWGHRNVQGLAQDSTGQLWATEFGQNTWDELNKVARGGNHGWPQVEGPSDDPRYVAPQVVWDTDEASPSGLAIVDDVAYVASLRGRRLWQVDVAGGRAGEERALFTGDLGRLRTVLPSPGGDGLWVTTSNTDGRGDPSRSDDRLLEVTFGP